MCSSVKPITRADRRDRHRALRRRDFALGKQPSGQQDLGQWNGHRDAAAASGLNNFVFIGVHS